MNLALVLILAATPASQSWQFETDGTPKVSVSNVNGTIQVEAVSGKTVSVEATQKGDEAERARYPIEVKQEGDEVTVQVCCGACGKKLSNCHNPPETHFVVKVPRDSSLEASSVNAPVKVSGVAGEQEVSVVSGDVSVKGSRGQLEVSAVSGNVELTPEALADTEVSTVSGNVKLKLPRGAGANVEFSSVGGSFNGKGVSLGSSRQKYGNGEHDVEVSTVGGSLDVQSE
ncbi:DUF4097 family beta strand repeat-containing protein [Archangium lansingense]|uniref:DUF4097 family beta strand repeat-containing protein n=1 Tax=Archangium lansingense TaxID=2995310 RepID=A0ABT4A5V9_9BACT|nr:DUF4097 family beta strand repeat-containing protein [Archangium lansinium]MCY1077024.1 DUF4097 family beta strand repeat-containing protein [Archangium lansinium]